MAENESLDLGGHYAKRWDVLSKHVCKGASAEQVGAKAEAALLGGLRSAHKQCREKGVTLTDLLNSRDSPPALRQLPRKMQGHDYVRAFIENAAVCGPTSTDCLVGWVDAIFHKVSDQICLRVGGTERFPTMDDALEFTSELRNRVNPAVERIATKLAEDPDWIPCRVRIGGQVAVNNTAELMDLSLLGAKSQ